MRKISLTWIFVAGWMALIFYLSHQPSNESNAISTGITAVAVDSLHQWFPGSTVTLEDLHFWVRKAAHFSAYFLLGILTLLAIKRSGGKRIRASVFAWMICVLYAASDEFHQLFVSGRSGEVRDVLIDSAGAFFGIVLYWLVGAIRRR